MELQSPALIIIVTLITVPVLIAIGFWIRFLVKSSSHAPKNVTIEAEKTTDEVIELPKITLDTRSVSTVSSRGSSLKETVLENYRNSKRNNKSKVTPTLQIKTSDIDAYQV